MTNPGDVPQGAVAFWRRQLPDGVPEELQTWIVEMESDVHVLWNHVGWMSWNRELWKRLSEPIQAADPRSDWKSHYDRLYFDSQVVTLTRLVFTKRSRPSQLSLSSLLDAFADQPTLCAPLSYTGRVLDSGFGQLDPAADKSIMQDHVRPLLVWRDKLVAHIERDARLPEIAWEELDLAIDALCDVFTRYSSRLTGSINIVDPGMIRWRDWRSVFQHPLFDSDGNPIDV